MILQYLSIHTCTCGIDVVALLPFMKFVHDISVHHVRHVTRNFPSCVPEGFIKQTVHMSEGIPKCVQQSTSSELWHCVFLHSLTFLFHLIKFMQSTYMSLNRVTISPATLQQEY